MIVELEGVEREKLRKKDIIKIEKNVWTEKGIEHNHKKWDGWACTTKETEKIWKT